MRRTIALIHARERAKAAETLARDNVADVAPEHRQAIREAADMLHEAQLRLARIIHLTQQEEVRS